MYTQLNAQSPETNSDKAKPEYTVSTTYLSNYAFNGRTDSVRMPYTVFSCAAENIHGFSIEANAYYLLDKNKSKVDFVELNAQYDIDFKDSSTLSFYASQYFNSTTRASLNNAIKTCLGVGYNYDFNFVSMSAEADVLISSKADVYANIELYRKWIVQQTQRSKFTFEPTLDINFSTLGYYEASISKNAKKTGQVNTSINTVQNPHFQLMDVELALPLKWERRNWGLACTTTIVAPQNKVTVLNTTDHAGVSTTSNVTPYAERNLITKAFVQLGFFIKF